MGQNIEGHSCPSVHHRVGMRSGPQRMPRVQWCRYPVLSHSFQARVLRAHTETDSLPSSSLPFCPLFILGSGPSILISCDKTVWQEHARLLPKSLAAKDKVLLTQCCPLPFFGMCCKNSRQPPILIAPSQLWHGGTPISTGRQVEGCLPPLQPQPGATPLFLLPRPGSHPVSPPV